MINSINKFKFISKNIININTALNNYPRYHFTNNNNNNNSNHPQQNKSSLSNLNEELKSYFYKYKKNNLQAPQQQSPIKYNSTFNNNNKNQFNNKLPNGNIEIKHLQTINKYNRESDIWVKFKKELKENPQQLFNNRENHLKYLKYFTNLTPGVQFLSFETWYKVRRVDFLKKDGSKFLEHYGGDHIEAIVSNFPNYNWKRFKFPTCPKSFWLKHENVIGYIEWLVLNTNRDLNNKEEWHYISKKDFIKSYGQFLIKEYDSVLNIFLKYYPNYNWKPWLFEKFPRNYFDSNENVKKFIIWLGYDILGLKSWEDFYQLKLSDFKKNNGYRIIKEFDRSVYLIITDVLKDEFKWIPWKFRIIPRKNVNKEILTEYFEYLFSELNIKSKEELINYEKNDPTLVERTNGTNIINEFGGSIKSAYDNFDNYNVREEYDDDDDEDDFNINNQDSFDDLYEIDNLDEFLEDNTNDESIQESTIKKKKRKVNPLKLK